MEMATWNHWVKKIDNSSIAEIDSEISAVEVDDVTPYVEKNLKLGYLYYSKDFLGTATKIFNNLSRKISAEKNNFEFIQENEKGLNIMYMGLHIVPDGCGGFDVFESDCCGNSCGPICGCLGIAAVMAICGISTEDVCSISGSGSTYTESGCIPDALNGCSDCCCGWYVAGSGSEGSTCIG